jgi:hypothetical protein
VGQPEGARNERARVLHDSDSPGRAIARVSNRSSTRICGNSVQVWQQRCLRHSSQGAWQST